MFNFKELIQLWRSDNLLTQALNDSHAMLEGTRSMFHASVKSLHRYDDGEMKLNVYEADAQVNAYERKVRRDVLKHLAITGGANIIPGLILTSIVIDIERLGDYTKNIMDLAIAHPDKLSSGKFEDDIKKIERDAASLFDQVIPALKTTDKANARKLIKDNWWMMKRCDEIITALIREEDTGMSCRDAVTTGLYARYLKRSVAHLINIATSIVNPFEAIGFYKDQDDDQ